MDSTPTPADIIDKVSGIVKKVAPFVGGLHAVLGPAMVHGRGLQGAPDWILDRLMRNPLWHDSGEGIHIANPITTTMRALAMPYAYPIIPGAVAALTGWILQYAGNAIDAGRVGTTISSIGNAMKGYGVAASLLSIPAAWVYEAPFNPGEAGGPSQTYATGYSRGRSTGGPGATNTYWQVRGGAQIRNATASVDVYPT